MSKFVKSNPHITSLIIEDNDGDYVLVEDFLLEKFRDIEIKHCSNYQNAVSYINSHKTELSIILLDLHLPDLSGIELIKEVLFCAVKVPVIILTGYSDLSIAQLSLQLGVYDFLVKDELDPNLLYKSVDFAINRRYFISQIESERSNYENLFNFSPQPMWLLDGDNFNILNANFSAIEKYGYALNEYQKMSFMELHPKEENELIYQRLLDDHLESRKNNFTHCLKNGNQIKVVVYCETVKGHSDRKSIIVQSNDVTETLNRISTIEIQNNKLRSIAWSQSHLVRAPLSRILGIVNLIENQKGSLDDILFWLKQLKASTNEMDEEIKKIVIEAT